MMDSPKKILAIKLRALGDTVLMTAPLQELRRAWPDAEIHALVPEAFAPLLENHPALNRIWTTQRPSKHLLAFSRLALLLRREKFDTVLNFHASSSSAWLARLTGAPVRAIHFHGHHDPNRYSTVEIPGKGQLKPAIERDMDAVRALGIAINPGMPTALFPSLNERKSVRTQLAEANLPRPLLGLGLGASRPTKSWPLRNFAEVAIGWVEETQGSVLAFLGPGEASLGQEFLAQTETALRSRPRGRELRDRILQRADLPIRLTAAWLAECAVFLGNDSGPKHLAAAVGTPTVTLFGPEDPFEWHPYSRKLHPYFFLENLACRRDGEPGMPPWCGLAECVTERHRCMEGIETGPVLDACVSLLKSPFNPRMQEERS